MKKLKVFFFDRLVGFLISSENQFQFYYTEEYSSAVSAPLSFALPLQAGVFPERAVAGYFGGLLPEGDIRDYLARKLGVSSGNDFALLKSLAGDCAGAVTIDKPSSASRQELTTKDLTKYLTTMPNRPLLSIQGKHRLSLAGAQQKLAVQVIGSKIYLASSAETSTHILKPAIPAYADSAHNEYFCMELARRMGLEVPAIEMHELAGIYYLLIARFDRVQEANRVLKLHQEDFSQALSVLARNKYEREGGPAYKDCFELISRASSQPAADKLKLLDLVVFNFLIANNDAHAKNFSLLYRIEDFQLFEAKLAPCYDLLCTAIYKDLDEHMSMRLGKQYNYRRVRPSDWERLASDIGINYSFMAKRAKKFGAKLLDAANELGEDLSISYPSDVYALILKQIKLRAALV